MTFERLLRADQEPQNWLTYSGTLSGQRYSLLTQITPENVKNLELQWVFQTRGPAEPTEKFEATPLVVDGVMYTVQAPNDVVALDAATGRMFWLYSPRISPLARVCCGRVNRGLAILGDTLFMGTIDGHLIAIDAKTGKPIWDVAVAQAGVGLLASRSRRSSSKTRSSSGRRAANTASAASSRRSTRRPARKCGASTRFPDRASRDTKPGRRSDCVEDRRRPVWVTGSYDPDLNLTVLGHRQPGSRLERRSAAGRQPLHRLGGRARCRHRQAEVALPVHAARRVRLRLDAGAGARRHHVAGAPAQGDDVGEPQRLLVRARSHDRDSSCSGKPFVKVNWMEGFDEKGRPKRVAGSDDGRHARLSRTTRARRTGIRRRTVRAPGLFYIPTWMDTSSTYTKGPVEYKEGQSVRRAVPDDGVPRAAQPVPAPSTSGLPEEGYGAIQAFDPKTGERKWEFKMADVTDSGVLTTASDLLFAGGREGYFFALDARTGEQLWKAASAARSRPGPMSYSVDGKQYVAISAGSALFVYALR